jgi:SecD/SecF fusion protein
MSLYAAVKLAQSYKNPPIGTFNSHVPPEYYAFGAPGSPACQAAGKLYGYVPQTGEHCFLNGGSGDNSAAAVLSGLPTGVTASEAEVLDVPRGMVILQAVPSSFSNPPKASAPSTEFFVLTDHVSLTGSDITNPEENTDQTGSPDVAFGFTSTGQTEFQSVTAQIAKRGSLVSTGANRYLQHFAIALDNELITVPSIDYDQYPDGILGGGGADITGGFTKTSAGTVARLLEDGPLSVVLTRR